MTELLSSNHIKYTNYTKALHFIICCSTNTKSTHNADTTHYHSYYVLTVSDIVDNLMQMTFTVTYNKTVKLKFLVKIQWNYEPYRYKKWMNQSECMKNSLVAFHWMADSFNPDVQVMVKMCVLSSLLPQLFLLSHQDSRDKTNHAVHTYTILTL